MGSKDLKKKKNNRQRIHSKKLDKYKNGDTSFLDSELLKDDVIENDEKDISLDDNNKDELLIDNDLVEDNSIDDNKDENIKSNNISKKIIMVIVVLFILLLISLMVIPRITFDTKDVSIRYNTKFNYDDYKAGNIFKDYTNKVKVKKSIDNKKIGDYEVEYTLKYGFITIRKNRVVRVIDDVKPEISLKGDDPGIVCPGKEYNEPGFDSIDEYDGDLTDKVKLITTKDSIRYSVKDKSGNKRSVVRKLVYVDKEKPKIELKGDTNIVIYVGSTYKEPGFIAKDNCDGDLTSKVEVSGSVNGNSYGTYSIEYKVKDSNGNEKKVIRKVEVKNKNVVSPSNGGNGRGIVYLTFDDGPLEGTTNRILDVLKEEGVEATFFVTCNGPDYLIKRMYNEGHTVALHTATHNYNYVYGSVNNYFEDLNRVGNKVKSLTGVDSKIIRFPGGSSNTISRKISPGIMTTLTNEVRNRGYKYFDWNVDSNDAAGAGTDAVYSNVINNISLYRENVVLMHDVKTTTRDAIRNIIKYGKNNGFTFKKITMDTAMVTHGVNN